MLVLLVQGTHFKNHRLGRWFPTLAAHLNHWGKFLSTNAEATLLTNLN